MITLKTEFKKKSAELKKFINICEKLSQEFPNPNTELNYINNFTLLISIILSAQSTDKMVNKVTETLFKTIKNPQDVQSEGIEEVKKLIKSINYFNTKAKNIFMTSKIIIEEFNSEVPSNFNDLIKLPGVGRKTANVFLNVSQNLPTIPVDTHVFRVTNRIFGKEFKKPKQTEDFLIKINNHQFAKDSHHLLVLHGRYICKSRKPQCKICKIKDFCCFFKNYKST